MSEYDLYHIDDKGRRVDLSDRQEELAEEAIERSADKMDEYVAMAEEEYMDKIYPRDHDEYLVDGAILECNQAIGDDCGYDDRGFAMQSPGKTTVLNVTGESYAKACGYLYHATVKDRELGVNIKPFPCNCRIGANTPEEKARVAEDELCQKEGNCRALINLNDAWDNLPSRESYFLYWNEENRQVFSGITMSSILFCKHGGIITAKTSGQRITKYNVKELMISKNPIALTWTTVEPATAAKGGTQKKIQNLCIPDGIVYFDKDGFQRVKNTGLYPDPYLVAVAEYYQKEAMDAGLGDIQGYGAIFKVTYDSGKEIFVTMGDLKDPLHTKESLQMEGENFYAGSGKGANTLEFFCNYLNENPMAYSENMSGKKGCDVNLGEARTVTEGSKIEKIDLLLDVEIEWENYYEDEDE